jgi:hypothetical protein
VVDPNKRRLLVVLTDDPLASPTRRPQVLRVLDSQHDREVRRFKVRPVGSFMRSVQDLPALGFARIRKRTR